MYEQGVQNQALVIMYVCTYILNEYSFLKCVCQVSFVTCPCIKRGAEDYEVGKTGVLPSAGH